MRSLVVPFALKDAPALIEKLLPVQKLSAEAYKEQMAHIGKTLPALGSYWKGRKPLVLNKACVLGCLLPATTDLRRDLEIFEKLMAMDDESFVLRTGRPRPIEILAKVSIARIADYFNVTPAGVLPVSAPVDFSNEDIRKIKVAWREDVSEMDRRRLEAQVLPKLPYRDRVESAKRPEEIVESLHDHIWESVNDHLGTNVHSFPDLVEQLGIMRFGHRPRVADTFSGSGQIPFEAARLGCSVYASDLNPVASMLSWGALHIVGGVPAIHRALAEAQQNLVMKVRAELDDLGVETDGEGWRAKVFLYCVEARCPQTGWLVPFLSTLVVSKLYRVIAKLVPDPEKKRYDISVHAGATAAELEAGKIGTVRSDGRGQEPYLIHTVDGIEYRVKISTLRGDYRGQDGSTGNKLRLWEKSDIKPRPPDVFQERLYAVEWMRPKKRGKEFDYEFRSVRKEDLDRELWVEEFISTHLPNGKRRVGFQNPESNQELKLMNQFELGDGPIGTISLIQDNCFSQAS